MREISKTMRSSVGTWYQVAYRAWYQGSSNIRSRTPSESLQQLPTPPNYPSCFPVFLTLQRGSEKVATQLSSGFPRFRQVKIKKSGLGLRDDRNRKDERGETSEGRKEESRRFIWKITFRTQLDSTDSSFLPPKPPTSKENLSSHKTEFKTVITVAAKAKITSCSQRWFNTHSIVYKGQPIRDTFWL